MDEIHLPDAIEPTEWFVVFHTKVSRRWVEILAFGRFKHVSAFAYCPGFRAWLHYDVQLSGTRIRLLTQATAGAMFARFLEAGEIVKIVRGTARPAWRSYLGFYCVTAVKHLLGLRCGALRPDALHRHILRHGGIRVDGRQPAPAAD